MTWKELIHTTIEGLPRDFTLTEILAHENRLGKEYPENRHIDAKIRQTLQVLRDQGVLEFLGRGRYRRLDVVPIISLHFDPSLAAGYTSKSQVARVFTETWAELNLYCLACSSDSLKRLPNNTPLADFACPKCDCEYQMKSKNGRIQDTVEGAEYHKVVGAVKTRTLPDYVLAEYDTRSSIFSWVRAIPGASIVESRIIARKPLSATAKRAGWVGCNISVAGLASVDIIAPRADDRRAVRKGWASLGHHTRFGHHKE
jgi:hypothetical protein